VEAADRRRILESAGVEFADGLSRDEIEATQSRYGFVFPPDLRDFLAYALPVSEGWVDWRERHENVIRSRLAWPLEGMCFDVEHNDFWCRNWGVRPASLKEAFAVVRRAFDRAPTLIPIYSHRFLPERPSSAGNPVFSVYQTDIVHYGSDLQNYLENEFLGYFGTAHYNIGSQIREIEFWSNIVRDGARTSGPRSSKANH
jgi:hypothetical protein